MQNSYSAMRTYWFSFFFLASVWECAAQTGTRDSLLACLQRPQADTSRIHTLGLLSHVYCFTKPDSSVTLAKEALALSQKIRYASGMADSYDYIGLANLYTGNHIQALEYFFQALQLNEKLHHTQKTGVNLSHVSMVYGEQREYAKALEYGHRGLEIKKTAGDTIGMAFSYSYLGDLYLKQGQFTQAIRYYTDALKMARQRRDDLGIAHNLHAIGDVYRTMQNYARALEYYNQSLGIRKTALDHYGMAFDYWRIGEVYYLQKDLKQAENYARQALQKAERVRDLERIREICVLLFYIHEKRGDYQKALYYYRQSDDIEEDLYSLNKDKAISTVQAMYDLEKKEKEINALKDKAILQQAEEKSRSLQRILLTIVTLLSVIIALMAIRNSRRHKKGNQLLESRNQEISRKNIEIMQINAALQNAMEEVATKNDALTQLNEHLDELVNQRTRVLERQNHQLAEYAYINGHKLRAPLANILGLVSLLKRNETSSETHELIDYLEVAAEKLDVVVHNIQQVLSEADFFEQRNNASPDSDKKTVS